MVKQRNRCPQKASKVSKFEVCSTGDCTLFSLFLHASCLGTALISAALVISPQQHPEENYNMFRIK